MNDLDTLIPPPVELQLNGERLTITPLRIGQLPAFLRAIRPAIAQLQQPEINWLALFGEHGDELLQAMAIAVAQPRAWVDALAADEAILLAAKIIEVNADFFTQTLMPKLGPLFTPPNLASAEKMAAASTPSKT